MFPSLLLRTSAALAACLLLSHCGGGSGSAGDAGAPAAQAPGIYPLAGNTGGPGLVDGVGQAARFNNPTGMAFDAAGDVIVSDTASGVLRKLTLSGVTTTLTGSPTLQRPGQLTVDRAGNLLVASVCDTFLRFAPDGRLLEQRTIHRTLGFGSAICGNRDFYGVAADAQGNWFASDTANHVIRRVDVSGSVTVAAGKDAEMIGIDVYRYSGSTDGPGAAARFDQPAGMAIDAAGNLFIAEMGNHTIRRLSAAGVVSTVAGMPNVAGSADGAGASAGSAGAARFNGPRGIAVDAAGNLFIADTGNHAIRKIAADGTVSTLAGAPGAAGWVDGPGPRARFSAPVQLAVDAGGTLVVADAGNHAVRQIAPDGTVRTLAGGPLLTGHADGSGEAARFDNPKGIAADAAGNLYIADTYNRVIRRLAPDGTVSTFAGSPGQAGTADGTGAAARFTYPYGLARDSAGNLLVTDLSAPPGSYSGGTVRRISPDGVVRTLAGGPEPGRAEGTTTGSGAAVRFAGLAGIVAQADGTGFLADGSNNLIRRVTPQGEVTGHAVVSFPGWLAFDPVGNLLVSSGTGISRVSPLGQVSTLEKSDPWTLGYGYNPYAYERPLAVDAAGSAWIAETHANVLRRLTQDGTVNTLVGQPGTRGTRFGPGLPGLLDRPGNLVFTGPRTLAVLTPGGVVRVVLD